MKGILESFGTKVRQIRKKQGLSQEELAVKAGLHYTYVGSIERGERNVSVKNIAKLAKALDVNIQDFFEPFLFRGKELGLRESIADYLKDKEPGDIELAERVLKALFAEKNKKA